MPHVPGKSQVQIFPNTNLTRRIMMSTRKRLVPEMKTEISQPATKNVQTKDDAYMQFMREMEGLL